MFGGHLQRFEPESFDRPRFVASAQDGADAWANNAGNAEGKWATNLQNTTKDIVGNAIRQKDVAKMNFARSIDSGVWERKLSAVGNAGIKAAAMAKKGNYTTGIQAGKSKYATVAAKLYPYIAAGQSMIDGMPSGTLAASKARATAWIDYMAAGKGSF